MLSYLKLESKTSRKREGKKEGRKEGRKVILYGVIDAIKEMVTEN